jgi:hypothetical protein
MLAPVNPAGPANFICCPAPFSVFAVLATIRRPSFCRATGYSRRQQVAYLAGGFYLLPSFVFVMLLAVPRGGILFELLLI